MIQRGVNINNLSRGIHPLITAVFTKNLELVKLLLSNNILVNESDQKGKTALHHAVLLNLEEIVKELLNYKADALILDAYGQSPLDYVVFESSIHKMLLKCYPFLKLPFSPLAKIRKSIITLTC